MIFNQIKRKIDLTAHDKDAEDNANSVNSRNSDDLENSDNLEPLMI